jgi:hypothetical protein
MDWNPDGEHHAMAYWGKVSRGVVVLPPGADLPEGTPVRVEAVIPKPLSQRLQKVIGVIRGMPPDWAENHDRYIHGTPKK